MRFGGGRKIEKEGRKGEKIWKEGLKIIERWVKES